VRQADRYLGVCEVLERPMSKIGRTVAGAALALALAGAAPQLAFATALEVGAVGNGSKAIPSCEGGPVHHPPSEPPSKTTTEKKTTAETGSQGGGAALARASAAAECLVVSRTSGFQTAAGGTRNPDVIPREGRIVAWTISLGNPTTADVRYFNEHEGGPAEAELGILEPVYPNTHKRRQTKRRTTTKKRTKTKHAARKSSTKKRRRRPPPPEPKYRLVAATPPIQLEPYFGMTAQFALETTIPVKKGDIIVLTSPTWAPALALGQGKQSTWRASRPKQDCAKTSEPLAQLRVGVLREYACQYVEARLTYSALLISTP